MAVIRQGNWLGQQRLDIPHIRGLESSVGGDFDLLAGRMVAGEKAVVVRGFRIIVGSGVTGQPATSLQVETAGGSLIHYLASENGSIFSVPNDRPVEVLSASNPRVTGGFVPGVVNYIGVDLTRQADDTTADLVMFMDADTNEENPKQVPLARTLDYKITISTQDFNNTPGIAPIAKVRTDSGNNITSLEDARQILFRLGVGGTTPNIYGSYGWPGGRREKTAFGVGAGGDIFFGGDKEIRSLKEWMEAVMTRVWEIGGGEFWYSLAADRNVKMIRGGATPFNNGEFFEWVPAVGFIPLTQLHWKSVRFVFDNSFEFINEVQDQIIDEPGLTDLENGECVYVDLDRSNSRTVAGLNPLVARKTTIKGLGGSDPPGNRFVMAWRINDSIFVRDQFFAVNGTFKTATHISFGNVKLSSIANFPNNTARVVNIDDITGVATAAGISRDNGYANNAPLGPGDVDIGRGVDDTRVNLSSDKVSTLPEGSMELSDIGSYPAAPAPGKAKVFFKDDSVSVLGGGIELTELDSAPVAPAADKAKLFLRDNGQPGSLNRTQVCVMWTDGSITVIAEGP